LTIALFPWAKLVDFIFEQIKRTLRIFISNLSHDQDVPESEEDEPQLDKGPTPSWTLKVEGRLIDVMF